MSLLSSRFPKTDPIWNYSNPRIVQRQAKLLFGKGFKIYRSNLKSKKYFIIDDAGKKVHFGCMNMEDYTHHNNEIKRDSYLKRSFKIKGNWKDNLYSPNNLSRCLLWNA
jgi:hypothetical protein